MLSQKYQRVRNRPPHRCEDEFAEISEALDQRFEGMLSRA